MSRGGAPRRGTFSRRERRLIVLAGVLAVLLSAVLTQAAGRYAEQSRLAMTTRALTRALQQQVDAGRALLSALTAAEQADDLHQTASVTRLTAISQKFLLDYPILDLIAKAVWLPADERAVLVAEQRERGFVGFEIIDQSEPGVLSASPARSNYLPISFLEPLRPEFAPYLGLDLLGRSELATLVQRSVDANGATGLAAPLVGEGGKLLLAAATYYGYFTPADAGERNRQLSGAFLLQFDVARLIAGLSDVDADTVIELRARRPDQRFGGLILRTAGPANGGLLSRWLPHVSASGSINLGDLRLEFAATRSVRLTPGDLLPALLALVLGLSLLRLWQNRRLRQQLEASHRRALSWERERAEVTLRSIAEAVVSVDNQAAVRYLNPVAEQLLGVSAAEACGRPLTAVLELLDEATGLPAAQDANGLLARLRRPEELRLTTARRQPLAVRHSAATLRDEQGRAVGTVLVLHDISRERELTRKLAFHACHDALTGLKNRRMFEHEVRTALSDSHEHRRGHAVMYLDLDQFKVVNDTCGHAAGDELLKQVAALFATQMRAGDLLARLGGDEFGVLVRDCSESEALALGERLRAVLDSYRYYRDEKIFSVGVSIGAVLIGPESGSYADLMSAVDMACYAAKDGGRNQLYLYRPGDDAISGKQNEMQWQARIQAALDENRFVLFWQPIKALAVGSQVLGSCASSWCA